MIDAVPLDRPAHEGLAAFRAPARRPSGTGGPGVTTTTRASVAASASTSMPSSSTGTGTSCEPARSSVRSTSRMHGLLDGDADHAVAGQRPQHQPEALGEPGHDDDVVGVGDRAADPPQVGGDHLAQRLDAAVVAVAGGGDRGLPRRLAQRPQPVAHREAAEIGDPVLEVDVEPPVGGRRAGAPVRSAAMPDATLRRRSAAAGQVALGLELGVAVDDEPPRHAELGGQLARRRQPLADAEPAVADGVAQLGLELGAEGLGRSVRSSPTSRSGPNRSTRWPRKWTLPVDRSSSYRGPRQHDASSTTARPRHDEPPHHPAADRPAPDHGDRRRPTATASPRAAGAAPEPPPPPSPSRAARRSARGPPTWPTPSPSTASTSSSAPSPTCAPAPAAAGWRHVRRDRRRPPASRPSPANGPSATS